ncbi:MAG: FadR/GntR family transcriptional regulator [Pilosibacter sp.]
MGTQTKTLAEQVADGIMNLIQETPYKAGDKLPTEKELCERTGAGRNTVREALKILASRNVLEIRQGAGTFVSEKQGIPDDPLGFSMVNDHVKLTKDLLPGEDHAGAADRGTCGPVCKGA